MTKFNDWLAKKLGTGLSTMTCFYVIAFLVIIPLFYSLPTSMTAWAQYLCSVIFQGIALPILGYLAAKSEDATNKAAEIQAQLLQETHDTVMLELKDIRDQQKFAKEERLADRELMKEVKLLTKALKERNEKSK